MDSGGVGVMGKCCERGPCGGWWSCVGFGCGIGECSGCGWVGVDENVIRYGVEEFILITQK